MDKVFNKRRLFFGYEDNLFQILNFEQSKKGDIYCGFPNTDFRNTNWQLIKVFKDEVMYRDLNLKEDGKLSVHASGQSHIRLHQSNNKPELIVKGNLLKSVDTVGVRHLFTMFPMKPSFIPKNSPPLNRQSDHTIIAKHFTPIVLIFFAIPKAILELNIQLQFKADVQDNSVDPNWGLGSIDLLDHRICWLAYNTTYMKQWPSKNWICYCDGCVAPLYVPHQNLTQSPEFPPELRSSKTNYSLAGQSLTISIDGSW